MTGSDPAAARPAIEPIRPPQPLPDGGRPLRRAGLFERPDAMPYANATSDNDEGWKAR